MIIELSIEIPEGSLEPDVKDIEDEIKDTLRWMTEKGMINDFEMEVRSL